MSFAALFASLGSILIGLLVAFVVFDYRVFKERVGRLPAKAAAQRRPAALGG